jgi:hypothetical protein
MSLDIFSAVGAVLGLMGTTYPTRNIRSTAELVAASHEDATLNDASGPAGVRKHCGNFDGPGGTSS